MFFAIGQFTFGIQKILDIVSVSVDVLKLLFDCLTYFLHGTLFAFRQIPILPSGVSAIHTGYATIIAARRWIIQSVVLDDHLINSLRISSANRLRNPTNRDDTNDGFI